MSIKQQQTQMLSAIFSLEEQKLTMTNIHTCCSPNQNHIAGLRVYQRSLIANANRALAITFATVHSFVGERVFMQLVKAYLQKHAKAQYDWGELGCEFPSFIRHQAIDNNAILAAIAQLDFECHQAERAENVDKDLSTLSLLNDHDAYLLSINFASGFKVLKSNHPVDLVIENIKSAHEKNNKLTLSDINQLLINPELTNAKPANTKTNEYYYLIWRPNFQAQYQQITQQEYHWLTLWQSSKSLADGQQLSIGSALDKTTDDNFSIIEWLPKAIEQQLISSISIQAKK